MLAIYMNVSPLWSQIVNLHFKDNLNAKKIHFRNQRYLIRLYLKGFQADFKQLIVYIIHGSSFLSTLGFCCRSLKWLFLFTSQNTCTIKHDHKKQHKCQDDLIYYSAIILFSFKIVCIADKIIDR